MYLLISFYLLYVLQEYLPVYCTTARADIAKVCKCIICMQGYVYSYMKQQRKLGKDSERQGVGEVHILEEPFEMPNK